MIELATRKAIQMTTHNDDAVAIAENLQLEHKDLNLVAAKTETKTNKDIESEEDNEVCSITEISQNQEALAQNQVE